MIVSVAILPTLSRFEAGAVYGLLSLFAIVRVAVVAFNWNAYNAELSEFRSAFALVDPGSNIISIKPDMTPGELYDVVPRRHWYFQRLFNLSQLQTLFIVEAGGFTSYIFSNPQKQVLAVRPEYKDLDFPDGGVPTPWRFAMAALHEPDRAHDFLESPIWQPTRHWEKNMTIPGVIENPNLMA